MHSVRMDRAGCWVGKPAHLAQARQFALARLSFDPGSGKNGVANGTRTRNIQNHNLGLYH